MRLLKEVKMTENYWFTAGSDGDVQRHCYFYANTALTGDN